MPGRRQFAHIRDSWLSRLSISARDHRKGGVALSSFYAELSRPLSVWSSRSNVGLALGRLSLLQTPEERDPPVLLTSLARNRARDERTCRVADGLETVVQEHHAGLLHLALLAANPPAQLSDAAYAGAAQASSVRSAAALSTGIERPLRGPVLLSARALSGLRRRVGKFRY